MKLSTTNRYGVRAVVDIAIHQNKGPVSIDSIAKRQQISSKYLEIILLPLKRQGMLESIRGAKGGYLLSVDPANLTVWDIVSVLEGNTNLLDCLSDNKVNVCKRSSKCSTRDLWTRLQLVIKGFLESETIQELATKQIELDKRKTISS